MRTQSLAKVHLSGLLLLPLVVGCPSRPPPDPPSYQGLVLPNCQPGQLLSIGPAREAFCVTVLTQDLPPSVCPSGTHALNAVDGQLTCVAKGTGVTNAELAASISNVMTKVAQQDSLIHLFQGGSARYCGQTAGRYSGRFINGATVGIHAARSSCEQIASCGSNAHLCSVYEMYQSVATGAITSAMTLGKAWVYMASWAQEFSDSSGMENEPGAGLADNCGGYTTADSTKKWYGTAVQWAMADSGQKALKFYSGPGTVGIPGTTMQVANLDAVTCDSMLPIACCR